MSATRPLIQAAFEPLTGEHRMEVVAEKDGVTYINNSRAYSINAAWYALELMPEWRRVHWLVGGDMNGSDHFTEAWSSLLPVVIKKVKAIYDIGVPPSLPLKVAFAGCYEMHGLPYLSLAHVVLAARAAAEPGDIVLLNPGCGHDHETVGHEFKQAVAAI